MSIPVNVINPIGSMHNIDPTSVSAPDVGGWISDASASGITPTSLPWFLAQGWQITNVNPNANPALVTYDLTKTLVETTSALSSLMQSYTDAYNEGRYKNAIRYNDIVTIWNEMLLKSAANLDAQQTAEDYYFTVLLDLSRSLLTAVKALSDSNVAQVEADADEIRTQLSAALAMIDEVTVNYAAHLAEIETQLTNESSYLADFIVADTANLSTLVADFTSHRTTAEGLLVDLGVQELARINEKYNAINAQRLAQLTARGFSSSGLITSIQDAVERERNMAIGDLNDRLAREKLQNEHVLYGQLVAVRQISIDATRTRYQARLDVDRRAMDERHKLLAELQAAIIEKANGYGRNVQWQLENNRLLTDARSRMAIEQMQIARDRISNTQAAYDRSMAMFKYALETRNNIITGLFGFMERRTDGYPTLDALATLVAQLGDSGATSWISP